VTSERLSAKPVDIVWRDQPALAKGAQFATLLGDPSRPGRYVFRLRVPRGHRVLPHVHPEERVYTVLSGIFHLGFGEVFSEESLEAYPEGSVVLVRAGRHHFQSARSGEYLVQIEGVGPTAVVYVNPGDDPRTTASAAASREPVADERPQS
jgi:mannose-6-phosphate isomerase-like protein (cupin superfamily)